MEMVRIFGIPAALLIVAVIANRLSRWTRVPDIIVLLVIGVLIGPLTHWANPRHLQDMTQILGMLALILILFEGGLELRLKECIRYSPGGVLLAFVSFGFTVVLVGLVGRYALHLSWLDGAILGSVVGSTSAAVVLPAISQIDAPDAVKITLTLESSLGEIVAVLTVGTLVTLNAGGKVVEGLVSAFGHHVLIDVGLGIAVGVVWSKIWPLVASQPFSNALNLGTVLGLYAVGRMAGGSGLLAELVFGLTLANMPRSSDAARKGEQMLAFHSELTFLVRSFFFVLLGMMAQTVPRTYVLPIIGILASLILARWLAVHATSWSVRDITKADIDSLVLMFPRGLITAVLALQVLDARGQQFFYLPAMAFTVVMFTNLFVVVAAVYTKKKSPSAVPAQVAGPPLESAIVTDSESIS